MKLGLLFNKSIDGTAESKAILFGVVTLEREYLREKKTGIDQLPCFRLLFGHMSRYAEGQRSGYGGRCYYLFQLVDGKKGESRNTYLFPI